MTNERTDALEQELAQLRAVVARLERRIGIWAENGLSVLDTDDAFAGYDGAYGTSTQFKRSDGT